MTKYSESNRVTLIGTGIILFFIISMLSNFFVEIIYALLLHLDLNPRIIIWSRLILSILFYAVGFIIGIDLIKASKKSDKKILFNLIVLLVMAVILNSLPALFKDFITTENALNTLNKSRDFGEKNIIEVGAISILWLLNYIIIGIIIYLKR